jgi:hypothetical protein
MAMDLKSIAAFFKGGLKFYASKLETSRVHSILIIDGNILVQYLAFGCVRMI